MAPDYFSFEDVMNELNVDEEELKRMVSEGELRAFRSENKMKFKQEDVDNLKKGRVTEPTVILPSTPTPPKGTPQVSEGSLDLDIGSELTELQKAEEEKPTEEIIKKKPAPEPEPKVKGSETSEEPLVFDETDLTVEEVSAEAKAPDDTITEEEEAGVSTETEPLKFADEPEVATEEVGVAEGEVVETETAAPVAKRVPRRRTVATQVPQLVEDQIERHRAHWAWTVVMFLGLIGTVAYGLFLFDDLRFSTDKIDRPSKLTEGTVDFVLRKFYEDGEWYNKFVKNKCFAKKGDDIQEPPYAGVPHRAYRAATFMESSAPKAEAEPTPSPQ